MSDADTRLEQSPDSASPIANYLLEVKVGDLTFSNQQGDILGTPRIDLSDRKHSEIELTLNDQANELWEQMDGSKAQKVTVRLGFPPNHVYDILTGKLYWVGRRPPDQVILEVLDSSYELNKSTVATTQAADEGAVGSSDDQDGDDDSEPATQADLTSEVLAGLEDEPTSAEAEEAKREQAEKDQRTEAQANDTQRIKNQLSQVSEAAADGKTKRKRIEKTAEASGLKFADDSPIKTGQAGSLTMGKAPLRAASDDAAEKGEIIVADGDEIRQVAPGQAKDTGIVLSWEKHRPAFVVPPTIRKKTPFHLASGAGALTVQGWSVTDKGMAGATIVTANAAPSTPVIDIANVPDFGEVKMSDPVVPGSVYTWGDVTRNGERIPHSKQVMLGAIAIAPVIQKLTDEMGQGKFQINSWYRTPEHNNQISSSGLNGPHTTGSAIDFWFPGDLTALHDKLAASHEGGVAIMYGVFIHLDMIGTAAVPGTPRRRWTY